MRRCIVIIASLGCLYTGAALSQTPRNVVPDSCHDKQQVQMLSSGEPVAGDADKIRCTVKYWVCGQHFTQSQVAKNEPDACERFTAQVRSKAGGEACCDCFPKCTSAGEPVRRKPAAAADKPQPKSDGKIEQLEEQVRSLEARLKALEEKLSGEEVTLNVAGASIKLKGDKNATITIGSDQDVTINAARNVSIKAGGTIQLKGAKIQQN
jgi:hypothetical protein